jgi:hypothetical protein
VTNNKRRKLTQIYQIAPKSLMIKIVTKMIIQTKMVVQLLNNILKMIRKRVEVKKMILNLRMTLRFQVDMKLRLMTMREMIKSSLLDEL